MEDKTIVEDIKNGVLKEDWLNLKKVIPVSSGGLHPGLVPYVLDILGKDCCLQLGGGIHRHPDGTKAGAMAFRQAIDAYLAKESLEYYASKPGNGALGVALEHFGNTMPV